MKVFFKWVLIIFLTVASVFVYRAYQDRNDGVLEEMAMENSATTTIEEMPFIEEPMVWQSPEGWLSYQNEMYTFSLAYPQEWEVQEALKPTQEYALHEISIHEKEYETHRASFIVQIFERDNERSVLDWWNEWLALEDIKKAECVAENGDNAPCLCLRDMVDMEEETEFAGGLAYKVQIFQFDHQRECVYAAKEKYIYGLCYDSSNPNDPDFGENKIITKDMLESFTFDITAIGSADAGEMIQGVWKSVDDEKAVTVFGPEGLFVNIYDGENMGVGTWGILEDGSIETIVDDEIFSYTVLDLTDEELSLSFTERGNTLEYIRVTETAE